MKKQLTPPRSDDDLERLSAEVWRRLLPDPNIQRYGRPGQKQHGVDLLGRRGDSHNWVGIQCKVRQGGKLDQSDIQDDLTAAYDLNPRLTEFIIATTARRDTKLQDFARETTAHNRSNARCSISTFFWDDFEEFLLQDANLDLLRRFYSDFMIEVVPAGICVSKMVSLSVGVDRPGTLYELIIGKTLASAPHENNLSDLAYFKDLAFILNLQTRTAALFRIPSSHHSAIRHAIRNNLDEYIIAKWLNSFGSIDAFLHSDLERFVATISTEEWNAFDPPGGQE